jgi:tetratricopeptide (TPR) repeat protein
LPEGATDDSSASEKTPTERDAEVATAFPPQFAKALADFNRGAALLEQYRYAEAANVFEDVLKLAPGWDAARFNLGLACLNIQETAETAGRLEKAREAFEAVLKADPRNLHARFCLGLYHQHVGTNDKALECFEAVYGRDRDDPFVAYKCGETLVAVGRSDDAAKVFERAIVLDPGFVSAVYRLALLYQQSEREEKAAPLFERFQKLNAAELTGGTASVQKVYGMAGKYYLALGADSLPLPPPASTGGRVLFSPQVKRLEAKATPWKWEGGDVHLPGLAVGDLNGDNHLDLCTTGVGQQGAVVMWHNDGKGNFRSGEPIAAKGVSPCLGDVDNDGHLDLWLGTATGGQWLKNDGKGKLTLQSAAGIDAAAGFTAIARLCDIDSDGDLDLLAFRLGGGSIPATAAARPAASSVYQNNRDGAFTDIAATLGLTLEKLAIAAGVYDDFDNDRDQDLILFPVAGKPIAWVSDRAEAHHLLDAAATGLNVEDVISATSGDPNKDGRRDLLVFAKDGIHLFLNRGSFRFEEHQEFRKQFASLRGTGGQFADFDNDGDLDILIADAHRKDGTRGPVLLLNDWPNDRFVDAAAVDQGNLLGTIRFPGDASCVAADLHGRGRCDILLAPVGEAPILIENVTAGGHWIEIDLVGMRPRDNKARSNSSAVGARVEVKAGRVIQQYVVGVPSGPVSMPPLRIHAGLGDQTKVEWLRILWPDGVLQAEMELPADQRIRIEELPRKVSSCPHLFVWDGRQWQFVSDFGGMGGLGYLAAPGEYVPPDPTEYVRLPPIEPRQGDYVLQVVEPLEEVVYVDEVKLIAVDHAAGTEVYPNELMAVGVPPPPFEVFCYKERIEPVRAVDHRGTDVTEAIRTIDRRYAGTTELDDRFTGVAKEHFVELDFGDRLAQITPKDRTILFLDGWVEYGYSSTNLAAGQAGVRLKAPSIHVERSGQWVELFHEAGYPAGLQHTMTLEVTGKLLPGDRRLRISSNMEIYWDRIYLAKHLADAKLALKEVSARSADLHFLGYPREYSPDGCQPNLLDYSNIERTLYWKLMDGDYTQFGDVTELVGEADDCFAIMGPGEELTLRFPAAAFGPVPEGRRRTFLLKTDSYCKDTDLHTAHPYTVGPLPFHGMSAYPYGPQEHYPDTEKTRRYQREYNTRRIRSQ